MAVKSAMDEKKNHAKLLYTKELLTQKECAQRAGVTEKTMGKWVEQYNWNKERAALTITREQQLSMLYNQLNEINNDIAGREEGKRYATSKEADIIGKLGSTIKKMENDAGIAEVIAVFTKFLRYLIKVNPDLAKTICKHQDDFLKTLLA
jgi:hypothetical protein